MLLGCMGLDCIVPSHILVQQALFRIVLGDIGHRRAGGVEFDVVFPGHRGVFAAGIIAFAGLVRFPVFGNAADRCFEGSDFRAQPVRRRWHVIDQLGRAKVEHIGGVCRGTWRAKGQLARRLGRILRLAIPCGRGELGAKTRFAAGNKLKIFGNLIAIRGGQIRRLVRLNVRIHVLHRILIGRRPGLNRLWRRLFPRGGHRRVIGHAQRRRQHKFLFNRRRFRRLLRRFAIF